MVTGNQIFSFLDSLAPIKYQMDFDNSGFLVGNRNAEVKTVLISLDITDAVITEAEKIGAQLIISHHPLIFQKLSAVCSDDPVGAKIMRLIRSNISAICMHTNLDIAPGGVNDALMAALGAQTETILEPSGFDAQGAPLGCGRIGTLTDETTLEAFLQQITDRLGVKGIRYVSGNRPVHRIAVCGGSGGSMLELAYAAGCDTFVTADVKYDRFLTAKDLHMNLIDADHFCTENVVIPQLTSALKQAFPELNIATSSLKQTAQFYAAP